MFCASCGQKTARPKLTLGSLVADFFVLQFSIEGRLFQTLKAMFSSPGKLTNDYWEGKRARYFSPLQIYLVTSVIFFLLLDTLPRPISSSPVDVEGRDIRKQIEQSNQEEFIATLGFRSVTLNREQFIEFLETESEDLNGFFDKYEIEVDGTTIFFARIAHVVMQPGGVQRFVPKYFRLLSQTVIVLMPVFGFILFGLYWRKAETSVKCIVFSAHLHAFAYLMLIAASLVRIGVDTNAFPVLVILGMLTYLVWAQKNVFGGNWWPIVCKSALAIMVYFVCLLFLVILLIPLAYLTL